MTAVETNVNFREHDIEFLQKRAKLWLEAVLGEKFGDRSLADLISDGSLLYRVSKYITREITGTSPGPQEISPKTFSDVAVYGKQSGKYLPYANVDTFLKTCRKVGLTDVELFTPPDAVEGKDIRRVCTSIRSLARKARAQHIKVPDFEDVNRPLPMPKEKVGEIKENLQHSNTTPLTSTVATTPEADIRKSERVISKFLSATSPLGVSSEENSDPSAPASFTSMPDSPSTPKATIKGISTPKLTTSMSTIEGSPLQGRSSVTTSLSTSDKSQPEKTSSSPAALSSSQPADQSNGPSLSYSRMGLGTFRHAQPHFIKKSSSQANVVDSASDMSDEGIAPKTPLATTAPSEDPAGQSNLSSYSQQGLDSFKHVQPHFIKTSSPSNSMNSAEDLPGEVISNIRKPDYPADQTEDFSSYGKLGTGAFRHAKPHFTLQKATQGDLLDPSHSEDIQSQFLDSLPKAEAPRVPMAKPKAQSSNKIVERDPGSTGTSTEMATKAPSRPTRVKHAPKATPKEHLNKAQPKSPNNTQVNVTWWMPLVAGALAFLGTFLVARTREPVLYEVKQGDTLSKISKQVGKNSWDELVKLNPSISNPHLIYPSERLKLPV